MSFKNLVNCYKKVINYDGSNIKNEYENSYIDNMKDSFFDNIAWTQVSKNFNYNILYDTWIFEGDTKDKDVPYKRLLSYPYDSIQFQRGDYIHFNYASTPTTWLLTTLESQYNYDINGRIYLCNNILKWKDEFNNTKEYPCVILDKATGGFFDYNTNIIVPDGVIYVSAQWNEDTMKITENKRFILNKQAFRVNFVDSFSAGNVVTFTMKKEEINTATDNIELGIADYNKNVYSLSINSDSFEQVVEYANQLTATLTLNGQPSTEAIEWISSDNSIVSIDSDGNFECLTEGNCRITARMIKNPLVSDSITITVNPVIVVQKENKVSPQTFDILQNQSITYEIYQFENNIPNSSGFNFVLSGASSTKYIAEIISPNKIKITSKGYDSVKLNILATNLIDSSTISWQIQLKNLW